MSFRKGGGVTFNISLNPIMSAIFNQIRSHIPDRILQNLPLSLRYLPQILKIQIHALPLLIVESEFLLDVVVHMLP